MDYEVHHRQFAAPFLVVGNRENNLHFINESLQNHIYGVTNALDELVTDALFLSSLSLDPVGERHLRYGVMRRLRMIATAFRRFQSIIPPDRTAPLTLSQSDDVCRYLNSIYIDLLGLLDNYAWTLAFQFGSPATRAADRMQIGLFKSVLLKDPVLKKLMEQLHQFSTWAKEVKERRNPAAHRMPLFVPSAGLTPADVAEQQRLSELASAALRLEQFDHYRELKEAENRLGTLIPKFLHDPDGPINDIYPTLPSDIGNAVKVGRHVQTFIRENLPTYS
ncbi:hypothetical protein [Sinorhizobium meliloti]|uniref:hypothetical protein n=1 Tax=Rhizobium meliloti TaxID=382 RepID=UPI003D652F4D